MKTLFTSCHPICALRIMGACPGRGNFMGWSALLNPTVWSDQLRYSVVAGGEVIARFTCLDILLCSFFDFGTVGSLRLYDLWTECVRHCFGYSSLVVIGLLHHRWQAMVVAVRCIRLIHVPLHTFGSVPLFAWIWQPPVIWGRCDNLASDGLKLFSHQHRRNAYNRVRLGYPRVIDCSLSTFLA
jgi:hypothetical protein